MASLTLILTCRRQESSGYGSLPNRPGTGIKPRGVFLSCFFHSSVLSFNIRCGKSLSAENAVAIFGNPYQVIRNRVVGISGFTHLQTTLIHASIILMNTVKIYQLNHLSPKQFQRCKAAQMEAAKVWNVCMETHKAA